MSKKPIIFTPEMRAEVRRLAATGMSTYDMSQQMGVTKRMLEYRCYKEVRAGRIEARDAGVAVFHGNYDPEKPDIIPDESRALIQKLSGLGLSPTEIAYVTEIPESSLNAYAEEDIVKGRAEGHMSVAKVLFDLATDSEHPNSTHFYLKAKCGWKETAQIEFPDGNGNPQSISGGTQVNIENLNIQAVIAELNDKV